MTEFIARLTQTILAAAAAAVSEAWSVGRVTAVAPGPSTDLLVTVDWRGGSYPAPYLASYTPGVGHVVLLARPTDQLVIVGRIIGTP